PAVIGVHRNAGNLLRPMLFRREGEDLGRRRDHVVVAFEQLAKGLVHLRALHRGLVQLRRSQLEALLHFPLRLGLEQLLPMRFPGSQAIGSSPAGSGRASASDRGARSSQPAIVPSRRATSSVVRPIGPSVLSCWKKTSSAGTAGTRPREGRKPSTLLNAAGLRSEPPMSLPSATGSMCSASATAAPPLLPPAHFDASQALRV